MDRMVNLCFLRNYQTFRSNNVHSHQKYIEGSNLYRSLPEFIPSPFLFFKIITNLVHIVVFHHCVISLMINGIEHLFMHLLAIYIFSLG